MQNVLTWKVRSRWTCWYWRELWLIVAKSNFSSSIYWCFYLSKCVLETFCSILCLVKTDKNACNKNTLLFKIYFSWLSSKVNLKNNLHFPTLKPSNLRFTLSMCKLDWGETGEEEPNINSKKQSFWQRSQQIPSCVICCFTLTHKMETGLRTRWQKDKDAACGKKNNQSSDVASSTRKYLAWLESQFKV